MTRHKTTLGYTVILFNHIHVLLLCLFFVACPLIFRETIAQKTATGNGPKRAKLTTESQWILESLASHNFFRSLHKSPPLVLNNTLNEISQHYANFLLQTSLQRLKSGARVYFEHNPEANKARIGENLFYIKMTLKIEPIPSPYAVLLWYEEIKDYDFTTAKRKPTSDPDAMIGHLTQLLWKSTSQMGTAYASQKLPDNQILVFVVANYFTAGNVVLKGNEKQLYLENVYPPSISTENVNSAIVSENVKSWWKEPEPKSGTPKSWRDSALEIHNKYRKIHGAMPLRLNSDMCKVGQLWANYLLERGIHDFSRYARLHQVETNFKGVHLCHFGETSMHFVTPDDDLSTEYVLKSWYDQSKDYDFVGNTKSSAIGGAKTDDFQKMIWNSTTEFCMSFARKKADNGQYLTYVVANYYPSIIDDDRERKLNVLPPSDSGSSVGSIFLTIFVVALVMFISVVGSMVLLFKYKLSWYNTIMKTVKLRK